MTNYFKCNDNIIDKDEIVCSRCKNCFHFYCEGLNEISYKKLSKNSRSKWICNTCKSDWVVDNKTIKITQSSNSIQELANSVKFKSSKFDDFNLTVSKILNEMK